MEFRNQSNNSILTVAYFDPTHTMELWMYGIILPCIAIPGIFSNLASVIVYSRKDMRSSMNIFLTGLGCFDFLLLFFAMFLYPLIAYCMDLKMTVSCHILKYSSLVCYPLTLMAHFGSIWTCVALTLDRYLAIRFPLQKRVYCTTKRSIFVLIFITIVAVVYCFPTMFEIRPGRLGRLIQTDLRLSEGYRMVYKVYGNLLVLVVVPWLVMIVLNIIIFSSVRKASKTRRIIARVSVARKSSRSKESEIQSTLLALLIIFVFLVLNLPAGVNGYLQEARPQLYRCSGCYWDYIWRRFMVFLGNDLVCLNSVMNFVVYCIFGRKFRKKFLAILLRRTVSSYNPLLNVDYVIQNLAGSENVTRKGTSTAPGQRLTVALLYSNSERSSMAPNDYVDPTYCYTRR